MPGRKPITQCTRAEWKTIIQHVRACSPPPAGWQFKFYWSAAMHDDADCDRDEEAKAYKIKVRRGFSREYTEVLVLHEIAHALAWSDAPHVFAEDHGQTWGMVNEVMRVLIKGAKYSKVFQAFHGAK